MNKAKKELIKVLENFTNEFYNLVTTLDEYEYKSKEDMNDYIIPKYPFDEDLGEVLFKVIDWKWDIMERLEEEK